MANAEKERSAAGAFMRLAELRPRHGALCAFATTLLSCMPVIVVLGGVPRYAALGDSFFLCLLLAAVAWAFHRSSQFASSHSVTYLGICAKTS